MAWLEIWLASSLTLLMPLSTGSAGQPRTWPVIGQSVIYIQASDWSQLTYQLLLVQPGERGRQLDGRRGEGGGQPGNQRGGGQRAWACY